MVSDIGSLSFDSELVADVVEKLFNKSCAVELSTNDEVHVSFVAFVEVNSFCVVLLLFTSCKSALFTGKLSKSVIIAA